jgi:hypothetical protein
LTAWTRLMKSSVTGLVQCSKKSIRLWMREVSHDR